MHTRITDLIHMCGTGRIVEISHAARTFYVGALGAGWSLDTICRDSAAVEAYHLCQCHDKADIRELLAIFTRSARSIYHA